MEQIFYITITIERFNEEFNGDITLTSDLELDAREEILLTNPNTIIKGSVCSIDSETESDITFKVIIVYEV